MKTLISFISFAILLACTTFGQVQAEPVRAWGFFNAPSSSSFTLSSNYQFNSKGGALTGKRRGHGTYEVRIPNMGSNNLGVCHAVAYDSNLSVQVVNWYPSGSDLLVNIKSFDPSGRLTDGRFVIMFYREDNANGAYTWVSGTGAMTHGYEDNSAGGTTIVNKISTGKYRVTFPNIKPDQYNNKKGTVLVTPYGTTPSRAQIIGWSVAAGGGATITVQMRDTGGRARDGKFVVSYINDFNIGQQGYSESADWGAFVWANNATAAGTYTPSATYRKNNAGSDDIKITRQSKGVYIVRLKGLPHYRSTTAIATAYGSSNAYTVVDGWNRNAPNTTDVVVKCFDPSGNPKDSQFTLFYYSNQNILY